MSDNETHTGRLRKVDLQGKTQEEFFQSVCGNEGIEQITGYSWKDTYYSEADDIKFYCVKNDIFELYHHVKSDYEDMELIVPMEDGSYVIATTFYNGGTCLSEVIESLLEKELNKNG